MAERWNIVHDIELAHRLAEVLKALAHPLRLRLVASLCREPQAVGGLCTELGVRQSMVSQHLAVLRMVGLVEADRAGGIATYSIREPGLRKLVECLADCRKGGQ
jgi:DNA-binding transcriptional ArsR family regulator